MNIDFPVIAATVLAAGVLCGLVALVQAWVIEVRDRRDPHPPSIRMQRPAGSVRPDMTWSWTEAAATGSGQLIAARRREAHLRSENRGLRITNRDLADELMVRNQIGPGDDYEPDSERRICQRRPLQGREDNIDELLKELIPPVPVAA